MTDTPPPASTPIAPVTVCADLAVPINRASGPVAAVTLRKPKAGEMRGLKLGDIINADVGAMITLIPRISEPVLIEAEVADLDPVDIAELAGVIIGFFMTPEQKAMMAKMTGASG